MRKLLYYTGLILMLTLVWMLLTEDPTPGNLLLGFALGTLALGVSDQLFQFDYYNYIRRIRPVIFLIYIPYLLYQVVVSGFETVWRVLTGRMNVGIVEIDTILDDAFERTVLANSITLTPGTVTVTLQDNRLRVLWIDCVTRDPERAGHLIKRGLERLLDPRRSRRRRKP